MKYFSKHRNSIFFSFFLISYLALGVYIILISRHSYIPSSSIQEGLAQKVLRFHVIADSDDPADQKIKLLVKNTLIEYLKPYLSDVSEKQQAMETISNLLPELENISDQVLAEHGYSYTAKASLGKTIFPIKVYGDLALPEGIYDALCVRLGRAEGKNWWCIMFPSLCFLDDSLTVVPEESKTELQCLLTEEEYEAILLTPPKIKYEFKLFQWLKNLFLD